MRPVRTSLVATTRFLRRFTSTRETGRDLSPIERLESTLDGVNLKEFCDSAFIPEKPMLITTNTSTQAESEPTELQRSQCGIPAACKWFSLDNRQSDTANGMTRQALVPSQQYLSPFGNTILPYELILESEEDVLQLRRHFNEQDGEIANLFSDILNRPPHQGVTFYRFNAPLSLLLQAGSSKLAFPALNRLYIAQAQISDLPKQLRDDLPTPYIVKEAGKGDVYDRNIWMGRGGTYTPLHKDPNPNLFVQLASRKCVRLFRPEVGAAIFRETQQRIGASASSAFRGDEMMEGPERDVLDQSVWGASAPRDGFEVIVGPGDALFIPKGWWHSIKSIGTDFTASANWWFR